MSSATDRLLADLDGKFRAQSLKAARQTVWVLCVAMVIGLIWAALAQISEITRGSGKVVPMQRMQVIQSLEGGILAKLLVNEGDIVEVGDVLVQLDGTRFRSAYLETEAEISTLTAEIARLEAEVQERDDIAFTDDADGAAQRDEARLFQARRNKLEESVAALEAERAILKQQIDVTAPLVDSGSVSKVELYRLQQQSAALAGKIAGLTNSYVQDAYNDLVNKKARLVSLQQVLLQRRDQLERTSIRARVSGRVNNVEITTIGGVVQPGETIMEVTPLDDQLLIETKVPPRDVAFVTPGMPASVKITAYDFAVYGDLKGTVTQISENTVEEAGPTGPQAFYRVMVTTEKNYLEAGGERYPIRPGMVSQVDIETGKRSVLSYLLRPLLRAQLR
ncbi:HlyD family efflux transporter periplasmic adaptor subunit [Aquicoccus porphyridii]|uniref:HlyD family efflux transporter periplasmic adaptor subunit n=1 Tax=Aquicoccus porphyridii TaxID=1852029 RepID=A0A5A9Z4Z5_9RHOB|nr:HlyD family efflux transporter periplasmic adaptor subunit [Aquicoccus porphyridii]KAA0912257.1 HlyD family efflux transporter periplasmic adaptor subunit [Aquicoccus porphyridii]RAI52894.1 hemolysin D [Rhodobacteraceae bacterium AsT-22]